MDDLLEPAVPTPTPTRRRIRVLGAAVLAAVLAGGVAAVNAGDDEPPPLALVAGSEADGMAEQGAATGARAAAPTAGDSQMSMLAPDWGGIEYRVEDDLPDLGGRARAWRVTSPDLDQRTAARMAAALGLSGTPEQQDGAWVLETAAGTFTAYPGDGWSISYHRAPGERQSGTVSAADAERQVRNLLERMDVLAGEWRTETFESEIGMGYACRGDLELREEQLRHHEELAASGAEKPDSAVTTDPALPADLPAPGAADCPPPPPPVPAQNVAFFPVVDGIMTDWSGWNVTVGPEGVEHLYGTLAIFEPADEYKLRSVDAALEELRSGGRVHAMPMPLPADDTLSAVEPSAAEAAPSAAETDASVEATAEARPAAEPAIDAVPDPEPQVVTITGVEHSLLPMPVLADGTHHMFLVPAYRFLGTYEAGEPWESSVIALHPDAIAAPPVREAPPMDGPVVDDAGGASAGAGGASAGAGSTGAAGPTEPVQSLPAPAPDRP